MATLVAIGSLGGPFKRPVSSSDTLVDGNGTSYLAAGSNVAVGALTVTNNVTIGGALAVTGAIDCESTLTLDSDLLWESDGGGDIGASGANRPDVVRAASNVFTPNLNLSTVYTVATLPSGSQGDLIYVSDGDFGSPCLALHDGSDWLILRLGDAVSAS